MPAALRMQQVAVTSGLRLFTKNTGPRKLATMFTGADVCPMPVCQTLVQQSEAPVNGGSNSDSLKVA